MSARWVSADEAQELLGGTTPGPWAVWEGHVSVFSGVSENTRGALAGEQVCEVTPFRESSHDPDPDESDCGCEDEGCEACFPTMVADARLIAAAPDLARTVIALHERVATMDAECLNLRRALDRCEEGTLDLEAQVRERCAQVCDNQALMLDAAGDCDGARAARLCASVLRALTPPVAPVPPAACPVPTEGP